MTRSVTHGSFAVERHYAAAPSRVFRAWSNPEEVKIWAAPLPEWDLEIRRFDFRIGGGDVQEFGPKGEVPFTVASRFDDIVADERIVAAYSVARGDTRISSSITCVEFLPQGDGTTLRITEHGAYLDGHDSPAGRKGGVLSQLDQLSGYLSA